MSSAFQNVNLIIACRRGVDEYRQNNVKPVFATLIESKKHTVHTMSAPGSKAMLKRWAPLYSSTSLGSRLFLESRTPRETAFMEMTMMDYQAYTGNIINISGIKDMYHSDTPYIKKGTS
jgi:hypothetical protein